MKKYLLILLCLGFVALSQQSCVSPNVNACFTVPSDLVDVGEDIKFTDCSINGKSYLWDFGDGTTSTKGSPNHTYTAEGDYTVTLTITKKKLTSTETQVITVGKRYILNVQVDQIPTVNSQGNPWDAGDNPDLQFFAKPSSASTWTYTSDENTDMAVTAPYMTTPSPTSVVLTRESWDFLMLDVDATGGDTLGFWTIDTGAIEPGGKVDLTGTNLSITVNFFLQ